MNNEGVAVQARLRLTEEHLLVFDQFGERFGKDERRLNRLLDQGASINEVKKLFIREGLTARHFNSIALVVKGKRGSRSACLINEIKDKKQNIKVIEDRFKKPSDKGRYTPFEAHQKMRLLSRLKNVVQKLESMTPRIIFGSRKLWNAQHDLEANGYTSHGEWLRDWQSARSANFFMVGSKDETRGNQSCQYDPIRKELTIRFPDVYGGRIILKDIVFYYGQEIVENAIFLEQAISYRFVKKGKGWYIYALTARPMIESITDTARGMIGADFGPELIAVVETDAKGNQIRHKTYPFSLYKKASTQVKATLEEIAIQIADWAVKTGKPVVIEDLDFSRKKAELKERGKGYARRLSGFAYERMAGTIRSRCMKLGVEVLRVNAAFSSIIGIVKFASMYGLSGDEAAALALARRGLRLKESLPAGTAFKRPEDRSKHVWSHWRRLGKALRQKGRHAFIAATRGSGGGPRVYPVFPARAAPA